LYNLRLKGYVPIIAHPERNLQIIEEPQLLYDFVLQGCLVQINSTSLTGLAGKKAKMTAELLLKHYMVHFIASDAHSSRHRTPVLSFAGDIAESLCGSGTADKLVYTNPKAVIDNMEIEIEQPIKPGHRGRFFLSNFHADSGFIK
jgi:protein-tyrosine phosphatase